MPDTETYAVVTGASSGLGEGFARALAARGKNLVLSARSQERLDKLAKEVRAAGVKALVYPADLANPESAGKLLEFCRSQKLKVDLVVNNAGFGIVGDFVDSSADKVEGMLNVNVVSATLIALGFVREMRNSGVRGTVLNIASIAAFQPFPGMAAYAATKAYVLSFSEAVNYELRKHGIRMLALCPGATRTEFFSRAGYDAENARFYMQTTDQVVATGMRQIDAGAAVTVSGLLNWLTTQSVRFAPRSLVVRIAALLMYSR